MNRNGYVSYGEESEDEVFPLPGFRFHPTDEELVGFYLRRKVEKKPIKMELIKHIDIYKFDPWDLPKPSNMENENYFFCKRGRKYRNSIRPNRVTGSGFWKATGIDKPVHTEKSQGCESVIGLKKTLVYYRGSAGKGTKTDWMMHEFRLPTIQTINHNPKPSSQEAEVWTLCRIFKRNVSSRKYTPDWRELASNKRVKSQPSDTGSTNIYQESYISFCDEEEPNQKTVDRLNDEMFAINPVMMNVQERNMMNVNQLSSMASQTMSVPAAVIPPSYSKIPEDSNDSEMFSYGYWDELRSVVEFGLDNSPV